MSTKAKSRTGIETTGTNGVQGEVRKWVYFFSPNESEGRANQKPLLGGKGANLAEMCHLGIPVPPGFTISTEACIEFTRLGKKFPHGLGEQVQGNMAKLEKITGKTFGHGENPLLVSVRSGAVVSMPGMMDTILNLGLNDKTVVSLAAKSGNERFAYDSYRRFIQMFSSVVLGIDHHNFEKILSEKKKERKVKTDPELKADALKELVQEYKALVLKVSKKPFPQDVKDQLHLACQAVFDSWNNDRAVIYRNLNKIAHDLGTAVNVQSMVFGNTGEKSGTGVAFTRDPNTGEKRFFGEYLVNAQGEDVVAGIRTPRPISDLKKETPHIYKQLEEIYQKLEKHYRDMQDIEFTFEDGELYMLQTRNGKRTGLASINIAFDLVDENLLTQEEAILRIDPAHLDQLLHPMVDPKAKLQIAAKGLPASPGAAVGQVVFNAEDAGTWTEKKKKVILVRQETSPEDVGGMAVAEGILTATGGMTSHAAVVARGMGKCCIVGCSAVHLDPKNKRCKIGDVWVKQGDFITLNGSTGQIIIGQAPLVEAKMTERSLLLMEWSDQFRKLKVRTNADTPEDARVARKFGAEGIGLCRTEHMFFGEARLKLVRKMILAGDKKERVKALAKLEPLQKSDFKGIFEAMAGFPVTIRLLDPPLHEFLPHSDADIRRVAKELAIQPALLKQKVEFLHELNPMLGHRGCRLAVTYPEIYEMQAAAIIEAACELEQKGIKVVPEIMVPLVGFAAEFETIKSEIIAVADRIIKEKRASLEYKIGTMIEVPRAAVCADAIAQSAEFFSFGTNDLTQMTLGFSRDDVGKFLPSYIERGILKDDPFMTLDQEGVGKLVKMATELGRSVKPDLKVGICGEHGGDPQSINFCHLAGLDYVSCSPYRVPIARLASAQAAIRAKKR